MSKSVTVKFVDFWPTFDAENNPIVRALRAGRQVTVLPAQSAQVPDILFYSRCGAEHYRYDCLKVYFTGENDFPNLNECDYAISFYDYDCGGRNLRYPLYMFYEVEQAANPARLTDCQALDRGFCSLVMSNSTLCHPMRIQVIDAVESYRPVAYGGAFRNNVDGRVDDKLDFIAGYKFNLALENSDMPGYVTEKILEPLAAATVPIFWGNEAVRRDFNPESYINVSDYENLDSFVRELRRVDESPELYLKMLRARAGVAETAARLDSALAEFLGGIADNPVRYVRRYGEIAVLHERNALCVPLYEKRATRRALKLLKRVLGQGL